MDLDVVDVGEGECQPVVPQERSGAPHHSIHSLRVGLHWGSNCHSGSETVSQETEEGNGSSAKAVHVPFPSTAPANCNSALRPYR